jgi:TetR/AcrR family fatty acid metabolism transcriptional regulator
MGESFSMASYEDQIVNPFSASLQNSGSDRKLLILSAADRIFSSKGYKETTIAEIAADVGIKDSVIYRHYKGKQDILFSIAEARLKEGLALLDRDLQGLIDPESRLRKMLWGNLWYQGAYPGYSQILYFECFSAPKFSSSPAFVLLQKYLGCLTAIFEQGIRENHFRNDVAVPLMHDIVMGTLNMTTTVSFHQLGEIANPLLDFEGIVSLVDWIITAKPEADRSDLDKTSMILEAAEKVFAGRSFSKAKMTEIAKLAGVADGTVYKYFKNKEALLFSIPKRRFQQYSNDLSDLFYSGSIASKLRRLIKYNFLTFLIDSDFTKIFVLNLCSNRDFYRSEAFEVFRSYYRLFEEVIEEGKTTGVFRSEIKPRIFRNMLFGTCSLVALRWLSDKKISELEMMKEINQLTDLLTEAVLAEKSLVSCQSRNVISTAGRNLDFSVVKAPSKRQSIVDMTLVGLEPV